MNLDSIIESAKKTKFGLWKLNFLLLRFIPFNKPHGFKVVELTDQKVSVKIPYKKSNLNHIKGLHACGMATAAEYSSGLLLLSRLGIKNYRIIMESLHADYHFQGKMPATATYQISNEELVNEIIEPLKLKDHIYKKCVIEVKDDQNNLLATITTNWQIKAWNKVKTKR